MGEREPLDDSRNAILKLKASSHSRFYNTTAAAATPPPLPQGGLGEARPSGVWCGMEQLEELEEELKADIAQARASLADGGAASAVERSLANVEEQLANVEAELSAEEQSKKAALQAAVGAVDKKQLKEMLTRR